MMTHSALSRRSCGMSSGISRISFRTVPQFCRRSTSFLSFAESGPPMMASAASRDNIRFSINSPRLICWQYNLRIPGCWAATRAADVLVGVRRGLRWRIGRPLSTSVPWPFDYTFSGRNKPARDEVELRALFRRIATAAAVILVFVLAFSVAEPQVRAQSQAKSPSRSAKAKKEKSPTQAAANRFSARVDVALSAAPASKGEWGLLIADAASGEVLYELNADKYFVPASNMKLFTTALALAKLGPDYRFHTTLETRGTVSPAGVLTGDVILVGRGDPNLSNRKFPYNLKEEFDGAPEKVLAELADALVAKGVTEVAGDVVGDDSYFPREPYPNGWEIDDMVLEYGSAVSAIVVDDNTVTLKLIAADSAGGRGPSGGLSAAPGFFWVNRGVGCAGGCRSGLSFVRQCD